MRRSATLMRVTPHRICRPPFVQAITPANVSSPLARGATAPATSRGRPPSQPLLRAGVGGGPRLVLQGVYRRLVFQGCPTWRNSRANTHSKSGFLSEGREEEEREGEEGERAGSQAMQFPEVDGSLLPSLHAVAAADRAAAAGAGDADREGGEGDLPFSNTRLRAYNARLDTIHAGRASSSLPLATAPLLLLLLFLILLLLLLVLLPPPPFSSPPPPPVHSTTHFTGHTHTIGHTASPFQLNSSTRTSASSIRAIRVTASGFRDEPKPSGFRERRVTALHLEREPYRQGAGGHGHGMGNLMASTLPPGSSGAGQGGDDDGDGAVAAAALAEIRGLRGEIARMVGRCRLPLSKPELKARLVSAHET